MDVTVINQNFAQIGRVDWQKAICMWVRGRVEIMEDNPDEILYQRADLRVHRPMTIKVLNFTGPTKVRRFKRLTKKTLLERDKGRCGYCGCRLTINTVTTDHIVPKSKGGQDRWENVVAACQDCNSKKGDRTLDECGMKLLFKPYIPKINEWFPGFRNGESWMPEEINLSTSHPIFGQERHA